MLQATTTLETTSTQGAKLTAPKRQFVLLENWDEAAYGPVSEQTVVERKVFGVLKKGVYRMTGKAGHYEVEDYDSQALTERTVEHVNDGESSLQAEGLQTKKEALQGAFREAGAEQKKNAAAVTGPGTLEEVLCMLQGLPGGPPGGSSDAPARSPPGGSKDLAVAFDDAAAVESSDEEDAAQRFSKALGKTKTKSKAKAVPKAKQTRRATGKPGNQKGSGSSQAPGEGNTGPLWWGV